MLLCAHCAQNVEPVPVAICGQCGRLQPQAVALCTRCRQAPNPALTLARAAALYEEPLRTAIHALKYEGRPELAAPLSRYLVAVFGQTPWPNLATGIDACLPVPLHPERQGERGYNQSALLATAFAQAVGLPLCETYLSRTRKTASQVTLSANERLVNVAGAFTASPTVAGKRLLVIDDVTTTGATLTACAEALKGAGAVAVFGLALAMPRFLEAPDLSA